MAGATGAGDDFEVGRTNASEERSLLVAINGDPDGYQTDFVLDVSIAGNQVLTKNPDGVDAIHATGTVSLPTGGAIGTIPEGNGVVGRGLNGLVGYVHAAPRDRNDERNVHAGALGVGGSAAPGLFGRGVIGVLGYADGVPRDPTWEGADTAAVAGDGGNAGIGLRGTGGNGGVKGESAQSVGVQGISQLSPGVNGTSTEGIGVIGTSLRGPGVHGTSSEDNGGVFESRNAAQLFLIPTVVAPLKPPSPITPLAINVTPDEGPPSLPRRGRGGQLMAVRDKQSGACSLWFCVKDGPPARWTQVLLGNELDGTG
ncbi:MAG: hypothetical protein M3072_07480 [Candidatus Dormibacteraeota bacterium]|nr:hypothetical protein [Candidatus Dormibacteraeota bacterium]